MPRTLLPRLVTLALCATLTLPAALSFAEDEMTADQIIEKSADGRSVSNSIQTMVMTIYDKRGQSRTRKIEMHIKEMKEGEEAGVSKSHLRFLEPEDLVDTQFLSIARPMGEDEQMLYMPAVGQATRISGSGKKNSFMGSDFSYEDLELGDVQDGDHNKTGEQQLEVAGTSFAVYVIESVPKAERNSQYSKLVSYVDKAEFVPRQIEFFDKKGEAFKRMTVSEISKQDGVLVPKKTVMENLKKGTRTEIVVSDISVNVPAEKLPDTMFTQEFLQSGG